MPEPEPCRHDLYDIPFEHRTECARCGLNVPWRQIGTGTYVCPPSLRCGGEHWQAARKKGCCGGTLP